MRDSSLSISAAIRFSWSRIVPNLLPVVAVYGVFQLGNHGLMNTRVPVVVWWAWVILGNMAIVQLSLLLCDDKELTVPAIFGCYSRSVPFAVAYLLFCVLGIVGVLLLVIPGMIVIGRCWLSLYLVMDRGLGPIEALRQSYAISRPVFWQILAVTLGMIVLSYLTYTWLGKYPAFVIGGVLAPFSNTATGYYYRSLSPSHETRAASV